MEGFQFEVDALPDDILQNVLCFISGKELVAYRRVCKRWRDIIDSQSLWKDKCVRENLGYVNHLPEPRDFRIIYFKRPYNRNLIKNPCAIEKLRYWHIKQLGGDGFQCKKVGIGCSRPISNYPPITEKLRYWHIKQLGSDGFQCETVGIGCSRPISNYAPITEDVPNWATSYRSCEKSQCLDLVKIGCSENVLDKILPVIQVSEWYCTRFDCGGQYRLKVLLLSSDMSEMDEFRFEEDIPENTVWREVHHQFVDYPAGVRFVRYIHSGCDNKFWAGFYGPKFTLSTVKIIFPSSC